MAHDTQANTTTLGNDGNFPFLHEGCQAGKRNAESIFHVDDTNAVGSDKTNAVFSGNRYDFIFNITAFVVVLNDP